MFCLLIVSLLIFRKITQTYKHTSPPPHPLPPPPKGGEGQAPPSLWGGRGEGGGGGGGVCLYVCVIFRKMNRETVSIHVLSVFRLVFICFSY